jgi:hypothetical protein
MYVGISRTLASVKVPSALSVSSFGSAASLPAELPPPRHGPEKRGFSWDRVGPANVLNESKGESAVADAGEDEDEDVPMMKVKVLSGRKLCHRDGRPLTMVSCALALVATNDSPNDPTEQVTHGLVINLFIPLWLCCGSRGTVAM